MLHGCCKGAHFAAFNVQATLLVFFLARPRDAPRGVSSRLKDAIPLSITFSFLVLPMVSSVAFRGLQPCEEFDDGSRFLKADYRLSCGNEDERSEEYIELQELAWLTVTVYVFIVPIVYYLLLNRASPAILSGRANELSRALAFFHADYERGWYRHLLH